MIEGFKDVVNPHTLKTLELVRFNMKLSELVELLNYLPELEVFALKAVTLDGFPRAFTKKAKVKKLKNLTIYGECFILDNFLKTLDVNSLKELSVDFSRVSDYSCVKQLIKLLEEQKELKNLTIGPSATWLFYQFTEIFNFKFRLTQFVMQGNKIGNINAFFQFLTIHSDTLEKLILQCMPPEYVFEVYEFVWNKLPVLKHTDLNAKDFYRYDWMLDSHPELLARYTEKLSSIESVDFLGVVDKMDIRSRFFKLILSKFSNAKSIDLSKINVDISWNTIIRHIGKEMKNLTVLRMPEKFEQKVLKSVHFPKLTEFTLRKIEDIEQVRHFIRRHSHTLEKVSFQWSDIDLIGTIIDEIRYCKNNKLVTISAQPKEAARLFNVLKTRARGNKAWNLKLEICEHVIYIYNYKFPDDVAFWNEHNNYWHRGFKETWSLSVVADEISPLHFMSIDCLMMFRQ
ncbi:hypothetical protein ACKWTF_006273 [Chironomus riparius]